MLWVMAGKLMFALQNVVRVNPKVVAAAAPTRDP